MAKRTTTTDEIERMTERLHNFHRKTIKDRNSFGVAYSKLTETSTVGLSAKQKAFRDQVFANYKKRHPEGLIKQKDLKTFEKAGGKDFVRDRQQTRNVVGTRKEFVEKGAQESDLKGVDTKPIKDKFSQIARVKGRIVYSRKTTVKIKGTPVTRFRDKRGRFVSVKR